VYEPGGWMLGCEVAAPFEAAGASGSPPFLTWNLHWPPMPGWQ
jgi:hypothetical protein